ncbi:MAG: hypothetical protein MOB07_18560, partial [Acidobacteria bacterium]|nr:hypothetical protein [Acidobacteriota bacterium]
GPFRNAACRFSFCQALASRPEDSSADNVAQPAEVAPLRQRTRYEAAQPRQVALLCLPIFILSGPRIAT